MESDWQRWNDTTLLLSRRPHGEERRRIFPIEGRALSPPIFLFDSVKLEGGNGNGTGVGGPTTLHRRRSQTIPILTRCLRHRPPLLKPRSRTPTKCKPHPKTKIPPTPMHTPRNIVLHIQMWSISIVNDLAISTFVAVLRISSPWMSVSKSM